MRLPQRENLDSTDMEYFIRFMKHALKQVLWKPDPTWSFYDFEHSINPKTISCHQEILSWAEQSLAKKNIFEMSEKYERSSDPIVRQGYELKKRVEAEFRDKRSAVSDIRILIQVPGPSVSPAHFSFYSNLIESLNFIGIPAYKLEWKSDVKEALEIFHPTFLLSTDAPVYIDQIDWQAVAAYRKTRELYIGLNARIEEEEIGNSPLIPRLNWAKEHGINFYFSFRDPEYTRIRKEYQPFFERGYPLLSLPFGANPLHYYPLPEITRDIDYCFLSSAHWTKGPIYSRLAGEIISRYPGFIHGIGWRHVKEFRFDRDRDRYLYARSKVGFNFHLPEQIEWACEVNERTHHLAMCGLPQLIDTPKLLPKLYSKNALFVCKTGEEFANHFRNIMQNPAYGQQRAIVAQREVFAQHTTFHRANDFVTQLQDILVRA